MFNLNVYANNSLSYSNNISLDNTHSWSVNCHVMSLDFVSIIDPTNNTDIGWLTANLVPTNFNVPNSQNYTLNFSANSYQTSTFMYNSVDPAERWLIIQTKYTSNSGITQNANNIFLRVLASTI